MASDERTKVIIEPFVGFIDIDSGDTIEWAADIDDRLDEAAAQIPFSIILRMHSAAGSLLEASHGTLLASERIDW